MVTVDEHVVEDLSIRDRDYRIDDFVKYLERHHHGDKSGISRDLIHAYADALGYDRTHTDVLFEERLTDSRTWIPGNNLYQVGDNVSIYPPSWHEQLTDSIDVAEYVRVMLEEKTAGGQSPGAQQGIPQRDLFTAIEIFADLDREMAEELVEQQRRDGTVVIYAYQNPEDVVRLPETTE